MLYSTSSWLLKKQWLHTYRKSRDKHLLSQTFIFQVKTLVALFTSFKLFYEYMVTAFTVSGQGQSSEITERWSITTCTDPEIFLSLSIPDKWVTFLWKHPYFHNLSKGWKSLSHKLIYNIKCLSISNHPGVQKVSIVKNKRTLHTC